MTSSLFYYQRQKYSSLYDLALHKTPKTKTKRPLSCVMLWVQLVQNGKDVQICSPRHKQTPGMVRDTVSSFLGIVMLMMVLVIGAVYQRLTAQPAPPPFPLWVLLCLELQCCFSGVIFHVFCVFSVSKYVSAWVYKQALTLFKTYGGVYGLLIVMHVCFMCVQYVL